jgi:predicted nucleic acid-binding protein
MTNIKAFVDTNVLLRMMHNTLSLHKEAKSLIEDMWENDVELWINRQVIREYLVQVTHPRTFAYALPIQQIMNQVATIQALFQIADENSLVTEHLLTLLSTYPTLGKQIHDANIIATMQTYRIDTLLTANISDMRRFSDTIKIIPLIEEQT